MNKCTICNKANPSLLYQGIYQCQFCDHAAADTKLSDQELFQLYSKNYFFGLEYSNYLKDQKVLEKNFTLRMKTLTPFLQRKNTLLEVGSAYGFFLNLVKNEFQKVQGIDICEEGVRYAAETFKLNVKQGDFLKEDFSNQTFDLICLWDTLEHLQAPELYIEKMAQCTEPGSIVSLTTGDIQSMNARFRKEKWRLIHPPTHLHYFSKKSLSFLLEQNGFEVLYNKYCGFYRSIDNIAYNIFVLRKKRESVYRLLKKLRITDVYLYMNLFDIMHVIARRV